MVADSVRREHGRRDEHDHPARMRGCLQEFRPVQAEPIHRGRDKEIEILRQEETRQRRDHVRENEDSEQAHEHHRQQFSGEQRADLRNSAKVAQQPVQHPEHERPEDATDYEKQDQAPRAVVGFAQRSRAGRDELRREQVIQARIAHNAWQHAPDGGHVRPAIRLQRLTRARNSGPGRATHRALPSRRGPRARR